MLPDDFCVKKTKKRKKSAKVPVILCCLWLQKHHLYYTRTAFTALKLAQTVWKTLQTKPQAKLCFRTRVAKTRRTKQSMCTERMLGSDNPFTVKPCDNEIPRVRYSHGNEIFSDPMDTHVSHIPWQQSVFGKQSHVNKIRCKSSRHFTCPFGASTVQKVLFLFRLKVRKLLPRHACMAAAIWVCKKDHAAGGRAGRERHGGLWLRWCLSGVQRLAIYCRYQIRHPSLPKSVACVEGGLGTACSSLCPFAKQEPHSLRAHVHNGDGLSRRRQSGAHLVL